VGESPLSYPGNLSEDTEIPLARAFWVTAQIRRAVGSIPANIAEGCGRNGDRELARFMRIAAGSASETEYLLFLAKDLGYLKEHDYGELNQGVNDIKRMLAGFVRILTTKGQ
jgi:four helix bundle protein